MSTATDPTTRAHGGRRLISLFLAWSLVFACAALATLLAWRWQAVVREQLSWPWDLAWETPNLCSIVLAKRHVNLYSPSTYNAYPFVLTAYTPLYHYIVALFPIDETNPFFYGRVVSLAAFIGLAALIALRGKSGFSRLVGLVLAGAFLSTWPITANSAFLKNDSLGILLAVAGMLLAARSRSGAILAVSALLWLAGLATKQSFLSAGIATAVWLAANDRQACVKYLLAVALWGAFGAIGASLCFGSGFWYSTIQAQKHPFDFATGVGVLHGYYEPLAAALVLAAAVVVCWQVHANGCRRTLQTSPCSAYFVLATLHCLLTCWKLGAGTNCLIESLCAASLVLAESVRNVSASTAWRKAAVAIVWGLCLAAIADLTLANRADYCLIDQGIRAQWASRVPEYRRIMAQIGINCPRVLNVTTHLYTFMIPQEPIFNDPWLYRTLWARKVMLPEPFLTAIERQEYDVVVTPQSFRVQENLPLVDQQIRAVLLGKYDLYTVSPLLRSCFFVRAPSSR